MGDATVTVAHGSADGLAPLLMVAAFTATDAVRFAGGLMFDRASLGWRVTVVTKDGSAPGCRALPILGATACATPAHDLSREGLPPPRAIAIANSLYQGDEHLRRWIQAGAERDVIDIRLWDGPRAARRAPGPQWACHRLSIAAQAFKTQALTAVGASPPHSPAMEPFRGPAPAHLIPLSPARERPVQ